MQSDTHVLLASPNLIRKMARHLKTSGIDFKIEKVNFKSYNSAWKGLRGIGLRVTHEDYCLYSNPVTA